MEITEAACVSDGLKEEEEVGQIVSLGDSCIKCVQDRIAFVKHANS